MFSVFSDEYFMQQALKEAQIAFDKGEIPVGAVVVSNKTIIAKAHNQVESLQDVSAHAEILAITAASSYIGNKYLTDCTLYTTLEPCNMCAGAIRWAQLGKLIYGASDNKNGFMKFGKEALHPETKLEMGILHDESAKLMKDFFLVRR